MKMKERPLNSLEALFAACNIRFALLVDLGPDAGSKEDAFHQTAAAACQSCLLGHLALSSSSDNGEWSLTVTNNTDNPSVTRNQVPAIVEVSNDVGGFLDNIIHMETLPVKGHMSVRLIPYESEIKDKLGLMLYVNSNHALCDGRSLTKFVAAATYVAAIRDTSPNTVSVPTDWKDLVEQSAQKLETWNEDPPFLLGTHNNTNRLLSMKDLSSEHSSQGNESYRFDLSGETMHSLTTVLRKGAQGATISGLLVAVIMHCLASEYIGDSSRDLGVSLLVDLRPYLQRTEQEDEINQAHGTVIIIDSTENVRKAAPDDEEILWRGILSKSIELTQQLRTRIKRGEAHRSALSLTRGHFDSLVGPATVELSNLGVCQIPHGARLYTAQRFDGYDGVSCMLHSESNEAGYMRWNVSVGERLDAQLVKRVFTNAMELCCKISSLNDDDDME